MGTLIYGFAQCLAWLEVWHALGWNGYGFAAARVAAQTRRPVADRKTAKTPYLNAMAAHQRLAHGVKQGFHGDFCVAVRQLGKTLSQGFNEIGSGHTFIQKNAG